MYDTSDELLREILAGEDSFLDWKEVVFKGTEIRFLGGEAKAAAELAKDLSCFANSEGGVIVFGVRKDRERVGLPNDKVEPLQQLIINVSQNNVEPPLGHLLLFDRVLLPDSTGTPRLCLKLEIKKAVFSVHAPKGRRPYHRLGDHCHEMTLEQQAHIFERRGMMVPFEERAVFRATLEDIERDRFRQYYERRYGARLEDLSVPYDRLLQNLKLVAADEAGGLHPTGLGLLLFSSHPDRHISGAYVDIAAYDGLETDAARQRDAKAIHGTIPEQIERTLDYLRTSPLVPIAATKDGIGRKDEPAYSLRALQESVVNALVHRDYGIHGAQVRVFLFPNRMEISNPGRLHNTLTRDDLFAGCQPVRRNQMLAGFLRDYESPVTGRAYMEGRGEGFLTMVRECQHVSGRPPELYIVGDSVKLIIYARPENLASEVGVTQ
jgi:predicted HTH transcriptional regulator